MKRSQQPTRAERAVQQVSDLNDFAWALNRAGYRAGLHHTHPAAEWLAECGVDLASVLRGAKPSRRVGGSSCSRATQCNGQEPRELELPPTRTGVPIAKGLKKEQAELTRVGNRKRR